MIRFVSVGKDIYCNNEPEIFAFSWFDTTVDRYIEICDTVVWGSWEEFEKDCQLEMAENPNRKIDIGRFYCLFQEPDKMAKLEVELKAPLTPAKYAEQLRRITKSQGLTVEQLYEILEDYPEDKLVKYISKTMTIKELAHVLGKDPDIVKDHLNLVHSAEYANQLPQLMVRNGLTIEQIAEILENYPEKEENK